MIRFSKYIWLYFLLSALVLVPGIYSLIRFGLRPGIDFTGGNVLEIKTDQDLDVTGLDVVSQQKTGQTVIIHLKPTDDKLIKLWLAESKLEVIRQESVGPVLGKELLKKSGFAAALAIVGILAYVAYAFRSWKYGLSAILALAHDLLVVFGLFSILGHLWKIEVDTLFITAVLTTMSFSVHDTIVVFDRIREYLRASKTNNFASITDTALTETMGRSLANSFTIIFMLLALVLVGGETIKWFAVALLIGTISGTYSSPFIATPLLILIERFKQKRS